MTQYEVNPDNIVAITLLEKYPTNIATIAPKILGSFISINIP